MYCIHELEWRWAHERLKSLCLELGNKALIERIPRWISESKPI